MGKRISEAQKKLVLADYVQIRNYCEVGRKHGLTESTIRYIVKQNSDSDFTRLCEQKEKEALQSTLDYIELQHSRKQRIFDKLLDAIEKKANNPDMFTSIADLAKCYGILFDKEIKLMELKQGFGRPEPIEVIIRTQDAL